MSIFIKRVAVVLFVTAFFAAAQAAPAFPVKYSANNRYLVDQNGTPFAIMGRTAWFVTSLSVSDYRTFVDDTAARGYNVIELHVVNHDPRGNHPPFNGSGDRPFLNRLNGTTWNGSLSYGNINSEAPDFTTPNEAYWSSVDGLLAYCESKGILVFLFPAYVGYAGGNQGWMQEMVANGTSKMQSYGAWIATRYKDKNQKNLVWMMGGDMGTSPHTFNSAQSNVEGALLNGLKSVAGQQSVLFSAEWDSQSIATDQPSFGAAMTLNGIYSWTGDVNNHGRRAYARNPVEPAFLLEGPYDEEGSDGNNYNSSATQPVRRFQWWGWLSTIGGYVSGNGYVWPFPSTWRNHLDTQGSRDMARLNAFMGSIAWYNLVPSGLNGMRTLITSGGSSVSSSDYVTASATPDGTLLVAYIPPAHSGAITVDMGVMSGPARARWFDPTSAAYTSIGTGLANSGSRSFTPPGNNSVGAKDWVLVLDNATGSTLAAPTISNIPDQTTPVNTTTAAIPFTINDTDTPVNNLTLSKGSSNPTLVPTSNIVFGGSGSSRTVTMTPAAGQAGSSTITVTVSDGTSTASDTFVLTVNAAAPIGVVRVNAGGGSFTDSAGNPWSADTGFNTGSTLSTASAINNTVNDALYQTERWDPSTSPELTYSFNVPNGNYTVKLHFAEIYSGNFGAGRRVFDVLMEGALAVDNLDIYAQVGGNAALVVSVPVTVNDGQLNIQFVHGVDNPKVSAIEVLPASGTPTISNIPDQVTTVNTATAAIPFTINDTDTPVNNLTLSNGSSNSTLVPANNIVFGGSGSSRTVTVTPAANQTGSATITVTVSDGSNSASDTFVLTVNPSTPSSPGLEGTYFDSPDFTSPKLTRNDSTINFDWGNGSPDPAIGVDTFSVRWVGQIEPLYSQSYTFYALTDDGFRLWINNQLIIDSWMAQPATERVSTPIALTADSRYDLKIEYYESGGGAVAKLSWSSPSQAKEIVPAGRLFPPPGTSPGGSTTPTISNIPDQATTVNTATAAIPFTVADTDTPVNNLTLSKGSSNPTLVPTSNIVFGGSGSSRTVTMTPAAGQTGSSTITVTVSDGTSTASDTFVLTVNAAAPIGVVRVNAGGGSFTDSAGNPWSADTGFNTGSTLSTASAINNTVNDALYQTERWDPSSSPELIYSFNVPNGNYTVKLYFAEIYSGNFGAGRRVFDVLMEGALAVDNLDIYAQVGGNAALVVSVPVTVNDGQLNIQFVHGVDNPKVSAIEVLPASGTPTISNIPDQVATVNTATAAIPFTVADTDTPVNNLTLSKGSSNPTLVPASNIVFGGSGSSRTVTVTPAANQTGSATITVTVSDGSNSASDTFVLTVNAVATGTVTASFTNATAIMIPSVGATTPYPSTLNVSGLSGAISTVTVMLKGLSHAWGNDIDVLLVGPGGQKMILLSDAGTGATANNANLTFSDSAAATLPQTGPLVSGTYKPTDYAPTDTFPSPAPAGPYATALSTFNGQTPNGDWSLYVVDDGAGDQGSFVGGWSLTITAGTAARSSVLVKEPPRITSIIIGDQGAVRVTVSGEVGLSYALEASSDLLNWTKVEVLENVTGSVEFVDQPTNAVRFYRAVSVPK